MITLLPSEAFGATVVLGRTTAGLRAVVVVKAVYDLLADGAGPRRAALRGAPAPDIRMADDLADWTGPDGAFRGPVDEADIALEKAFADIVVEGFVAAGTGGAVTVDDALWLERRWDAALQGDVASHLFGRQSRVEPPRRPVMAAVDPVTGLPGGYSAGFNNLTRRTPGFLRHHNRMALPPGGVVAIAGAAEYRFRLPQDRLRARIRWWSGQCPDRPERWALDPVSLAADTLVVTPAAHRATVLWRGRWPWANHPADSYRAVEITREEA